MTQHPDEPNPEEPGRARSEGDRKLDEDAAWRLIVENFGERVAIDEDPAEDPAPPAEGPPGQASWFRLARAEPDPADPTAPPLDEPGRPLAWEDEGHYVPPDPPPLPTPEPRRALAWAGLFGAPFVMLVGVVFALGYPTWLTGLMVVSFIGGFVYLVATMPRNRPDDWSGDDGAVV
jgi:hypothetical protein